MSGIKKLPGPPPVAQPQAPQTLVRVISPDDEVGTIDASEFSSALENGYKPATKENLAALQDKKTYGTGVVNELEAGALGFLRGSTFGLSDLAMREMAPDWADSAEKLKKYNPTASIAGEVGSFLVPALGSIKAAGTAGKVAASTGILQRLVSQGAGGLGEVAAKIVGENLAGKVAGSAVKLGAEAAVYQAAHNLSENALEDKELTAESILAGTGQAAILGVGIGGAIPLVARGTQVVASKAMGFGPVRGLVNKAEEFFDPNRSRQLYTGAMQKELNPETGQRFQDAVDGLGEAGLYGRGKVDFDPATATFRNSAEGGALPSQADFAVRVKTAKPQVGRAMGDVLEQAEESRRVAGRIEPQEFENVAAAEKPRGPAIQSKKTAWSQLKEAGGIDDYDASRADAAYERWLAGKGPKPPPFEGGHFDEINRILDLKGAARVSGGREAFDKLTRGARRWDQIDDAIEQLRTVPGLKNIRLPNAASEAMSDASFDFGANAGAAKPTTGLSTEPIMRKIDEWAANARISDSEAERLRGVVDDINAKIGAKEGDLLLLHKMRRDLDARIGPKNWSKLGGEEIEVVKDLRRALSSKIEASLEGMQDAGVIPADMLDRWRKLNKLYGDLQTVSVPINRAVARSEANVNVLGLRFRDIGIGAVGGGVLGGPAGVGLAVANKALQTDRGLLFRAELGEKLQKLAWAEKLTQDGQRTIADGLKGFLEHADAAKVAAEGAKKLGKPIAFALEQNASPKQRTNDQQKWFEDTRGALMQAMQNPQAFAQQQGQQLQGLADHAPAVADAVLQKQLQVYSYLLQAMPKNPGVPLSIVNDHWKPADYQVQDFRRVVQVARAPLSIMGDLKTGTVTAKQVDAVKTLYPKLYESILTQVQSMVNAPDTKLTYQQQLKLGRLFPGVIPTMQPQFVAALQNPQTKPDQPPAGHASRTQPTIARRRQTESDRAESR